MFAGTQQHMNAYIIKRFMEESSLKYPKAQRESAAGRDVLCISESIELFERVFFLLLWIHLQMKDEDSISSTAAAITGVILKWKKIDFCFFTCHLLSPKNG